MASNEDAAMPVELRKTRSQTALGRRQNILDSSVNAVEQNGAENTATQNATSDLTAQDEPYVADPSAPVQDVISETPDQTVTAGTTVADDIHQTTISDGTSDVFDAEKEHRETVSRKRTSAEAELSTDPETLVQSRRTLSMQTATHTSSESAVSSAADATLTDVITTVSKVRRTRQAAVSRQVASPAATGTSRVAKTPRARTTPRKATTSGVSATPRAAANRRVATTATTRTRTLKARANLEHEENQAKPKPRGQPKVWAEVRPVLISLLMLFANNFQDRQALCEAVPQYYKSWQSSTYHNGGVAYGLLLDKDRSLGGYMDHEIIICRA